MKYKKIVVTGGSGLVGSSLKEIMPNAIYLSSKDFDLATESGVDSMYKTHNPDAVIHLAARVGGLFSNLKRPAEYFTDNILMNTLLMNYAHKNNVGRFISVLSTCVYPDKVDSYPMTEEMLHSGPPTPTNFSYGYAKRCLAVQTEAYNKQYKTQYQYLIPSNLYGEYDKYGDDNSHFVAALIKKIHVSKKNGDDKIVLYGTGQPLRQFMYAKDLAYIINYCLENDIYENMNVANNENLSIENIAKIALKVCDAENLTIQFNNSYSDGQFRKDVSSAKLMSLIPDFEFTSLENGIKYTYKNSIKLNKI